MIAREDRELFDYLLNLQRNLDLDMRVKFILLLSSFLWFSCKKTNHNLFLSAPLLSKTVTSVAGDTLTTTLEYSGGKVTLMRTSGTSAGKSVNTNTLIIRNAQGIIETIVIKNPAYLTTFTSDSIVYEIHYSSASHRYANMVNDLFLKNGNKEHDSTYFDYDAQGNLVQATKLINDGSTIKEGERNEFTYGRDNLIRCKNYIFSSLFLVQSNIYDNKINPMGFGKEWILIGSTRNNRRFEQSSFNNATTISYDQNGTTSSTTMNYAYNANNLPEKRTNTSTSGEIQTVTYFYQ
jgi:hypothetical protein